MTHSMVVGRVLHRSVGTIIDRHEAEPIHKVHRRLNETQDGAMANVAVMVDETQGECPSLSTP